MLAEVREVMTNSSALFPALKGRPLELAGFVWFQGWNDQYGAEHEAERRAFVEGVFEILKFTLDDGFLKMESIKSMFTPEELAKALGLVEEFLINRQGYGGAGSLSETTGDRSVFDDVDQ
jgi:hypothetical protein